MWVSIENLIYSTDVHSAHDICRMIEYRTDLSRMTKYKNVDWK